MKALVTGGGGFLGGRIARMLLERGDDVTALGRREYPEMASAGVRLIQADIRDTSAVARSCQGMEVVFHAAAITGIWGPRAEFESINVGGTQNVIAGCRASGVPKLIYTSSPSVVFGKAPLSGVDESQPYPQKFLAAYPESKARAERLVLSANGGDLLTVSLRPHLIFGPGDPNLIPRVVARANAGKLRQVGNGKNLVDVTYIDNAAEAHLLAADSLNYGAACAGKSYFISQGEPVRLWPWLNELLVNLKAKKTYGRVSLGAAYTAGAVLELLYRFAGITHEPEMTRFLALQLGCDHYFDISASGRDFAYSPRITTQEGVSRTVEAWHGGVQHC